MKIAGRGGREYEVRWSVRGFSYAESRVYHVTQHSFLGFRFTRRKLLWDKGVQIGSRFYVVHRTTAESMHPNEMRRWFQESVDAYESYCEAWDKEV